MPIYSLPDIDFHRIRPHNNSRHGGFEELSVQLFRTDVVDFVEFTRVDGAGGDGGVEAIVTLKDGKKIGLQAKYFDRLESKQWQQIDKSVKSALKNHPTLTEYRVVVPIDRSPGKIKKWDAEVKRWQAWAKQEGIRHKIRFVWWGASELKDLLTTSAHNTRLLYWFGCKQFSEEWLDRQNQIAVADLDCRYTPKYHVRTEAEALLDAFTLSEDFVRSFYMRVKAVFDACRNLNDAIKNKNLHQSARKECISFTSALHGTTDGFGDGETVPPYKAVFDACSKLRDAGKRLLRRIDKLNRHEKPAANPEEQRWRQGPFDYTLTLARRSLGKLEDLDEFLRRFACADFGTLLVVGPAGSGKSHLLATAVLEARKRGQPAIIVLGEHFLTSNEPWTQLIVKVGWEGTVTEFLSVMSTLAEISGRPALLCIDALNESAERSLWRTHLNSFTKHIEPFPNIRLLVSCRSDFVHITLPEVIAKRTDHSWAVIEHIGFGGDLFEAVAMYFSGYGIETNHFPPLLEEFQNPLFLKTFCEAFENSRLPGGPITLDMVMKRRLSKVCEKLVKDIDCPEEVTRKAIGLVVEAVEENHGRAVPKDDFRMKVDALFHGSGEFKSLYRHLKSNAELP